MRKTLLIIFMAIIMFSEANSESIIFSTFKIPLMVENPDKGVFIELTKEIKKRSGLNIVIQVSPPKRALNNFRRNKTDVLFPALDVNFQQGIKVIKSRELIYIKTDYVFTRKGDVFLRTLTDLEGKKIGITLGYPYIRDLLNNNLITIDVTTSDILNVKKLIAGRFDAFVVEEQSGLKAFRKTGNFNKMQYDRKVPLSKQKVYYAFQNTNKGKSLEKSVSNALKLMKKDGTFERLMSITR